MSQVYGNFAFVLHTHLPYVLAYGKWPYGTDWLNEAVAETYIPLLNLLNRLIEEGISPKLTISITPILTEQLADESFKVECVSYLQNKIDDALANQAEFNRFNRPHMLELAKFWQDYYTRIIIDFKERYGSDLVGAFKKLQDEGHIEIITCAATHGYLPLLSRDVSIQAQIKQGVATYSRHYDRPPRGIWLPECAHRPGYEWTPPVGEKRAAYSRKGIEEFLSESQLEYFIIDSHLLAGGKAMGVYIDRFEVLQRLWSRFEKEYQERLEDPEKSPYEVYLVGASLEGKKPVAVFTRDSATGLQVWRREHGYPGEGWYLDFHKKHFPGGHRYWRVTSAKCDLADKWEYKPDKAAERVPEDAGHFKDMIKNRLRTHYQAAGKPGILVSPFATELFGHWWFEGCDWLYHVLKGVAQDPEIELTTCGSYLDQNPPSRVVSLHEGSWGEGGSHRIWLNDWTEWTWKHIYKAEAEMQELAKEFGEREDREMRAILKQAARELLLLQSSDWQFLISTWAARDYAEIRLVEHYQNFKRLAVMARRYGRGEWMDPGEWNFLGYCEEKNRPFSDVEPKWWAG
ncbi:MAG: 1,4-alpha-glucan branching protein domain-containing protein [bacterium]